MGGGCTLGLGPRQPNYYAGSDAPLNALAHGRSDSGSGANRPTFGVLCRWVSDGLTPLVPGENGTPPSIGLPPRGGLPWPEWNPAFPFAPSKKGGPEVHLGWPSAFDGDDPSSAANWQFGERVEVASPSYWPDFAEETSGQPWLRLGTNFFVLLQSSSSDTYGATLQEAWFLGMVLRVIKEGLGQMHEWAEWERDERFVDHPESGHSESVLADYTAFTVLPESALEVGLGSKLRRWVSGIDGRPVHFVVGPRSFDYTLFATPGVQIVGLSRAQFDDLQFNGHSPPQPGASSLVSSLITEARSHWGRAWYGEVPAWELPVKTYEWIRPELLLSLANSIAKIAGRVVHEIGHLAWRRDFPLSNAVDAPSVWGISDFGGPAVRPTENPSVVGTQAYEGDRPFAPPCTPKHWSLYVLGWLFEGLLRHDVRGVLDAVHDVNSGPFGTGLYPTGEEDCPWSDYM